jgi:TP901 family phage tail tape measure protein
MIIDELIALLGFETKGEDNLKKFNDGLDTVEKKAKTASDRINAMSVAIGSFVGTIAANVVSRAASTIGSLPGEMTSAAADFESLMTGIQKKAGATAEQMEAIGREVLDLAMGGELASSIDEIATAYERGAAAGLPLDELREFALLSTKAADAFEMSAEATGNAFVGFQKVLGVAGEDLERVADLINYLADSGIADERDIVQFMDSAGALAKTIGFSVEETAALAAALVNLKIPAGEAATAMNSVLTKLIAPQAMSKGARAAFQAVAGDVNAFAKSMSQDADQALVGLLEKLAQLDSSARAGAIAEIFGLNHADVVQQLVSGVDELKRNLAEAKNEAAWLGSLQDTYAMKLDDFWSKSQRFWNNTKGLLTIMGERTLPIFGDALDTMSDFIHRIAFDGSLTTIADGFEKSLRAVRDFGRNMWSAARFAYGVADGVTELVSRVTGLNKVASAGLLGAAVLGTTATGRAGMKWLAAKFPAVAGILLLEDMIAGLSGETSYIGGLEGGQEALDAARERFEALREAIDGLAQQLNIGLDWSAITAPSDFVNREIVKFIQELAAEIQNLTNALNAFSNGDYWSAFSFFGFKLTPGGLAERIFGKQTDEDATELPTLNVPVEKEKPATSAAPLEPFFRWLDSVMGGAISSKSTEKGDRLGSRADEPSSDRFGGDGAQPTNAEALSQALENFRVNMVKMAPDAAAQAVANDNSVANDNRDMSVTVNSTVNQTVQQATQAPAAAAQATSQAVGRAAAQPAARVERSSAF